MSVSRAGTGLSILDDALGSVVLDGAQQADVGTMERFHWTFGRHVDLSQFTHRGAARRCNR
jgi:hypothetical protein